MKMSEELQILRNQCRGWRIAHARTESRLMEAEKLLVEAANFVDTIKVGATVSRRNNMSIKLRSFVAAALPDTL